MTTSQLGSAPSVSGQTPPLESGDRLTRPEFERRYAAVAVTKAELIEGVVYVASPLRFQHHVDNDGIIRSRRFPGLWLAADAMLSGDMAQVLAVLQARLQSSEHQDFVDQLSME